MAWEKVISSK